MSQTENDIFSDDDSYKDHKIRHNNVEESILDESDYEDDTSVVKSRRESTIMPVKRRTARVLNSDSDDESTYDKTPVNDCTNSDQHSNENNSSPSNSRETSIESADTSDSITKMQGKSNVISSEDDKAGPTLQQSPQQALIIDSSSDIKDLPEEIRNDATSNDLSRKHNIRENSGILEIDKTGDMTNLFPEITNVRMSQQFQYNSEGILNSTSLHPANLEKQGTVWRLSNNFNQLREAEEVSSDSNVEILSGSDTDVIDISSGEEILSPQRSPFKPPRIKKAFRQQTLQSFIVKKEPCTPQFKKPTVKSEQTKQPLAQSIQVDNQQIIESLKITVSKADYETQRTKVNDLEIDYVKLQNMRENINLDALPDKGKLIKERLRAAENRYHQEKEKFDRMNVSETKIDEVPKGAFANVAWEDLEAGTNAVLPKTFGKKAMSTYNTQKAVTLDRLQQLHEALQTCPKEDDHEEDPKGLKVPLMNHQKGALAWTIFREKEKPSGGILADDMGLGKTLTMISLIVKSLEIEKSDDSDEENDEYISKKTKHNGGSLIVCPASLLNQWSGEIDRRLKRGLVSYCLYHGPKRETQAGKLAQYDIVITTYSIINNEADRPSAVFKIKWRRVILDEAHTIRNYKAQTSVACCQLMAKSRWALTGTPMHNKELDMYALLKFLRCSPFDDLQVWKRWVGDKSAGGMERLHTVISSLMLRRTKQELMEKGRLQGMPDKTWELVKVKLDEQELKVYHKVLIFSQTLFAQFLHQRAEKNQDYIDFKFTEVSNKAPNQEYHKMRQKLLRLNKVKDVSQHEILVLLLRLRQICCHPSLITAMLEECGEGINDDGEEKSEHLNLLDQLEKLNIQDDEDEYHPETALSAIAQGISQENKVSLKDASKGQLRPSDPVFAKDRASSKVKAMLKVLKERVLSNNEKAIIVSQWSSYLKLVAMHLEDYDIEFNQLDGQVPVHKRMDMVDRLNNPKDNLKVLLLSLTAGGVGLNLVGANHLFLLDLHWNPQLENQAQDRIYRVGQTKPVFVYKFLALDTIEERIKALQEKKLAMAEGLLTGTKQATQSKLSMEDLRMIFGM